ncbi:MAG: diphthine--ammonia ligase [Methanomicrobiales archaeon]|nr:diphthine--ammonia ligase [Methanomicrobiales archaeon]MDD1657358.1 diphthine--ammonia ligase [Methanomicrobiales archaeon]
MRLGVLFSGGKDSAYACWRAMQHEEVACLISVVSRNEESYMFHTPNIRWVPLQAEAADLPLVQGETEGREEAELGDLRQAIRLAMDRHGIEGVVSGALQSVYQASRIQRICAGMDLWCFNPLWHADPHRYLQDLITRGFRVVIAGVFSRPFDASWLGRGMDRETLRELEGIARTHRLTLTGEGGEYETFVLDAPFFRRRIVVQEATPEFRNDRGVYRIARAALGEK